MANSAARTDYDVVVVGAGPIGLSLAVTLAQRGHRVGLFERFAEAWPLPRAVAMSHDSARTIQSMGLYEAMKPAMSLDEGEDVEVQFVAEGGEILMSDAFNSRMVSGFPAMTGFNQPDFESVMGTAADATPGLDVHRGWIAHQLTQDETSVQITFVSNDGAEPARESVVSTAYVIGADGSNSTVRTLIGAPVHDMGFTADWLVADIMPKAGLEMMIQLGQKIFGRPTTFAPSGPGRRRLEFMLLDGERAEDFSNESEVWRLLSEVDVNPGNADLVRAAVYTFRGRWAEKWCVGRVLLAGDAAHQMPPLMAQGFNSGMRDVVALAWRLDLILRGHAPADLLDSYTTERLAHVRQIIENSVNIGHLVCITDPQAQQERNANLRALRDDPSAPNMIPPAWRSGPGVFAPEDDQAGYLGVQGRVEIDGRVGLLDDLIGYGHFVMISRLADPLSTLTDEARAIWQTLDGVALHIAADGPVRDVDGFYASWLDEIGADVAIMRPDFLVFGAAREHSQADQLVRALAEQLNLRVTAHIS